ncbi:hypothetical protein BGZ70_010029 [Mortierella alpina]|uniref:WD40 repeat-like protein n=1 Tax=Mortierella alpina TaxID=64518 RepID=A0A9P6J3A5_MORAP|nr:hypothetical protein BGZ70_010029 [Mortierella alpina]
MHRAGDLGYLADGSKILVYHFSTLTPSGPPTFIKRFSDPRCTDDQLNDKTINILQIGHLGTEEVLVSADEAGDVCVWFTMNLQREPLLLSVTESAWGVAIHSEKRLIAVSSNAHTVTIFHCGLDTQLSHQDLVADTDRQEAAESQERPRATGTEPVSTSPWEQTSQQILRGHGHNIPCVTFSPCGEFVATASVDQTCRTWRLSDGKQIQQKSLGQLWGWGVCFINDEAWMSLSREDYKRIPKGHLEPGNTPGMTVRDSPMINSSQRRQQAIREYRMIRSRWYAGPLHNTSCDELAMEDESELEHHPSARNRRAAAAAAATGASVPEDQDQDTALFGMDDDEGEDELEEMSTSSGSSSQSEITQERPSTAGVAMQARVDLASAQDAEVSADTGEDGDVEGTGMDTEDGAGTAEESVGTSVIVPRRRASASQEHQSSTTPGAIAHSSTSNFKRQPHISELSQPIQVSISSEEICTGHLQSEEERASVLSARIRPRPQYPKEILACATARNVYLLGRYPPAPIKPSFVTGQHSVVSPSSGSSSHSPRSNESMPTHSRFAFHDHDSHDDEDEDQVALVGMGTSTMGQLLWVDELEWAESEYDPDYDTDPYFEDADELMVTEEDEDEDNTENDDQEDDSMDDDHPLQLYPPVRHAPQSNVPVLHTLSVAREAAARADGRMVHHLGHFDRLFVMLIIPELSVLIAASQKGSLTIFRLLRVMDDTTPLVMPAKTFVGLEADDDKPEDAPNHPGVRADPFESGSRPDSSSPPPQETITVEGAHYVLFPEVYLPRQEPPPLPLMGVSVVPLQQQQQRPTAASAASATAAGAASATLSSEPSSTSKASSLLTPLSSPLPSSSASSASFLLHLAYIDAQIYTYEIRLRNEKDDPVGLSSVFV